MRALITHVGSALLFAGLAACDSGRDDTTSPEDTGPTDADGDGWTIAGGDCDDVNAKVHPDADEACDGLDDDCDGALGPDEVDDDADGWMICQGDCDDDDPSIHPGVVEVADDGIDQDCDGGDACYQDSDRDGYGSTETVASEDLDCTDRGESSLSTDCDDRDLDVHPCVINEVAGDGVDQDCDGYEYCYQDADEDGDGYGTSETVRSSDLDCTDPGESAFGGDCDEGDPSIHPGAAEICEDGIDQDCNGLDLRCPGWGEIDLALADAELFGCERDWHEKTGKAVAVGDVDDDGYGDILIGAPGLMENFCWYQYQNGGVHLVFGPFSGKMSLVNADATLYGEDEGGAGGAIATGDVDGDGTEDIVVGGNGNTTLVLGPISDSMYLSTADAMLVGAGSSVATGDVSGDDVKDILVQGNGAAYVVYGPAFGTVDLSLADAQFVGAGGGGYTTIAAGDVNGDGISDMMLVGATGATYIQNGPVSGTLDPSTADASLICEADACSQEAVATGDMDGDGLDDVIVGVSDWALVPIYTTYVVHGPVTGTVSLSTADAELVGAGFSVATGDVDGDGVGDVLAGAPCAWIVDVYDGAAYLVFGPVSGTVDVSEADAKFATERFEQYLGWSLATGDTDGDGAEDVLIGAPDMYMHDYWPGYVYLILGGGS